MTDPSAVPAAPTTTRAVAIGGGHGLSRTLAALARVVDEVTAVVTVADDGGSSGRLRRDHEVVAMGDLRMALAALARDRELAELVQFRFDRGELTGHSLGNLVLVAMQQLADGDVVAALDRLARLLDVPGRVLPCTTVPVTLHAKAASGDVDGQVAVMTTPRLQRVWLEPDDVPAAADATAAVAAADLVVLGPGSLYTSVLPNLLVPGIAAALAAASCPIVLVANLREQPGETEGMSPLDHLDVLAAHVPGLVVDAIVVHDGARPAGVGRPLSWDQDVVAARVAHVVAGDLLDGHDGHDPDALAGALRTVLRSRRS